MHHATRGAVSNSAGIVDQAEAARRLAHVASDVREEALERIRHNEGPGQDPDVAAIYWLEFANCAEWPKPPAPVHPNVLERRDLA